MPSIPAPSTPDPSLPENSLPENSLPENSLPEKSTGADLTPAQAGDAQSPDHAETTARFNEAGVRNAQANWLDGINALLYAADTGYLQQRGAAAVGGYDPAQQAMGKLYQQAQDSLANDHQRGIFAQATAPMQAAIQARIHQHAQEQGRVYDADASRARALSARPRAFRARPRRQRLEPRTGC
jgi:hypothetical protein